MRDDPTFGYVFPAIRGIQAGREYYASMCPLRLLPKIFLFDEEELGPEMRAQRTLNKGRLPDMARYMANNPSDYVFSAITASIDGEVRFDPLGDGKEPSLVGVLRVPMSARFIINDGQHRRAAIELALRDRPSLGGESIAVVFFVDLGLERCQQMFADLNRHAVRPSKSLGVLYDYRDDLARLTKLVVLQSPFFRDIVEMARSTLSPRSRKLFTLSALYNGTSSLLSELELPDKEVAARQVVEFWEAVAKLLTEWQLVRDHKMSAGEVRRDFIHSHGIVLHAVGIAGNALIRTCPANWKTRLKGLRKIDWARNNTKLWEGRAMVGGQVCKAGRNVTLTTNVIKRALKLDFSPEEHRAEEAFLRSGNGHR